MTKETTQKIKGIAILIMILHHFLVYDFGVNFPVYWKAIGGAAKICVGIYAVLSGYGYFFAKEKTLRYGLTKIWSLLKEYWISLFTIFIPCAVRGGWKLTPKSLLVNLFALGDNLNWNAWYVHFFIFCMLTMPFLYRVFRFRPVFNVGIALLCPYAVEAFLIVFVPNYKEILLLQVLFNCVLYFGCFLTGYLLAQYDVISRIKGPWVFGMALMVGAIFFRIVLRHLPVFGFNMDVIYAAVFVIGAANFFERVDKKYTGMFDILGKYSTGMWFIHAIFFVTYTKDYFLPIMTVVKWLPMMYVWLVGLSLLGAVFYRKLLVFITIAGRSSFSHKDYAK